MTTALHQSPRPRLQPVPPVDPPYDDELTAAPVVDGSLALAFPQRRADVVPLRLVPPAVDRRPLDASLPEPRPWVARVAQAMAEVFTGTRAAAQLSRFASYPVLEQLERTTARMCGPAGSAPVRQARVVSVRVCRVGHDVVESAVVIDTGVRRRALALRVEGRAGRWECTALQLG